MARIEVITSLSWDLRGYAELLRASGELLASGSNEITWRFVAIGRPFKLDGFSRVGVVPHDHLARSSMTHGAALNRAAAVVSGDVSVLADVDVCFLKPEWDVNVVRAIGSESIDLFGVEYHADLEKYRGTPGVFFMAFRPGVVPRDFDFRPKLAQGFADTFIVEDAEVWGVPTGTTMRRDTGWRLPLLVAGNRLRCRVLPCVGWRNPRSVLCWDANRLTMEAEFPGVDHGAEWHYGRDAFVTHRKHGRHGRFASDGDRRWLGAIRKYLAAKFGLRLSTPSERTR